MIKVYYLPKDEKGNLKGVEIIHGARVTAAERPDTVRVIMDTTGEEDAVLAAMAIEVVVPTKKDIDTLNQAKAAMPGLPSRDYAAEIDDLRARMEALEASR